MANLDSLSQTHAPNDLRETTNKSAAQQKTDLKKW
jgi:hypothetical protein